LADAIERHRAAADRLARTRTALDEIFTRCVAATAARERAEAALAEARDAAPQAWVRHLVDGGAPPAGVEDAERALAEARNDDDATHQNQSALQDELRRAEVAEEMVRVARNTALNAAVAADPAVAALLDEHRATRDRLDLLATILNDAVGPLRTPASGRDWNARPATEDSALTDARLAAAAPWRAAIETLAADPDAGLPPAAV
jgi:hypothetical protein